MDPNEKYHAGGNHGQFRQAWASIDKGPDRHTQAASSKEQMLYRKMKKHGSEEQMLYKNFKAIKLKLKHGSDKNSKASKHGNEQVIFTSKYDAEEDVFLNGHTSVWGSYWNDHEWGYQCCKQKLRHSICLSSDLESQNKRLEQRRKSLKNELFERKKTCDKRIAELEEESVLISKHETTCNEKIDKLESLKKKQLGKPAYVQALKGQGLGFGSSEKKTPRSSSPAKLKVDDIGAFEKNTYGIGVKLLAKMGYTGGGLGKYKQGIVAPIQAKLRPSKMGMGFNYYKEATLPTLNDYKEATLPTLKELEEKKAVPVSIAISESNKKNLCSKSAKKMKISSDYITADEMLKRKQEQGIQVVQKGFDMRGPQVCELTNLETLNAEKKARENDLMMAEWVVQRIDLYLRNEREKLVKLQREMENFKSDAAKQKKQLSNMKNIISLLDGIREENSSGKLTLVSLAKSFSDLQKQYPDDYKTCNISYIACSYAIPLFMREFQGWDPLQDPTHGVDIGFIWKNLLEGEDIFDFSDAASPYSELFMETVYPAIRISGTNTWQARDPDPVLLFLKSWEKLIPPSVLQSVLDHIIMPKLSSAVESWDPRIETIPIHVWLLPWRPVLGKKLETFYHTIRNRLESVLHAWQPSDVSAYYIVSPWKTVFDPVSWEELMVRFILPKLLTVMQEFQVNPADHKHDQFIWILTWATDIPVHHMRPVFDIFFDKLQQVVYNWVSNWSSIEEVTQWYLGWKELIPEELLADEHIANRVNLGLEMMNPGC